MATATWRELITYEMLDQQENWDLVVSVALPDGGSLDTEFDNGFGGVEGCPFTLWTQHRVYFPTRYDGAEWVDSVPRDPNGELTGHVGGG